jgi:adenylate cyclase class 2
LKNQELEVKFFITASTRIEGRLSALGARLSQPRQHEVNLRFDTPEGELSQGARVLRLRQDDAARLTYKGPSAYQEGVRARTEIEFVVSDFDSAQAFLEALGYQVTMMYEKYRTTYALGGVHVTLDEMPYGNFVEVEGSDPAMIQRVSQHLKLDWERRVPDSYTTLFERLRQAKGWDFRDLSFSNFVGLEAPMETVQVLPADEAPAMDTMDPAE